MQYLSDMMVPRPSEEAGASKKELLAVSFNQDCSALAVGHDDGYALYLLRSLETLEKVHEGVCELVCLAVLLLEGLLHPLMLMEQTWSLKRTVRCARRTFQCGLVFVAEMFSSLNPDFECTQHCLCFFQHPAGPA